MDENTNHVSFEVEPPPAPLAPIFDAVLKPQTWDEYLAYWISQVGSPPALVLLTLILITLHYPYPGAWLWSTVYLLLVMGIPLTYLLVQVRRGNLTDVDVQLREQRSRPFLVTLGCLVTAWIVMFAGGAPPMLMVMTGAAILQSFVILLITIRWKISVHSATAAGMTVLILRVVGLAAAPLVVTVPLIAWSRIKLRRHTLPQTLAGILLGSGIYLGAIWLGSAP